MNKFMEALDVLPGLPYDFTMISGTPLPSARGLCAALLAATAIFSSQIYAQSVTTDPVGFVTISVSGGGSQGSPAYTFTSLGLVNPVAFQSTTTTSTGGATTLVDTSATWTDNQYNSTTPGAAPTYFVEITSGTGAGTMYDITGTVAATQTLNLASSLQAGITSGASYRIRQHWTIASVFGTTNLAGGSIVSADQVQLLRNQGYATYYYQTSGLGGIGWRQAGAPSVDASATVIYPNDGILIARQQSASVSVVITGAVKTGQTSIPVITGYSLLGNVYSSAMTLASSNLYTGDPNTGLASGSVTSADQVMLWNGTSGFNTYYYQTIGIGGTGWRQAGAPTVDASATAIPVGAALLISRTGAAFNWVTPQTPASFN
jgi:uncharacterized protein (TIGR02597 family)